MSEIYAELKADEVLKSLESLGTYIDLVVEEVTNKVRQHLLSEYRFGFLRRKMLTHDEVERLISNWKIGNRVRTRISDLMFKCRVSMETGVDGIGFNSVYLTEREFEEIFGDVLESRIHHHIWYVKSYYPKRKAWF